MVLIDSIVVRYIRIILTVVMYSSQLSHYQLYFYILLYSSIDRVFTFNLQRLCDRIGWGIRSQFLPIGFFGFSYQAAHLNSLA